MIKPFFGCPLTIYNSAAQIEEKNVKLGFDPIVSLLPSALRLLFVRELKIAIIRPN